MRELLLLVLIDSAIWASWSFVVGYSFNKIPDRYFKTELLKVSKQTIKRLETLRIKKWKDIVPEAGEMFTGGKSKKALQSNDASGVAQLIIESRRAEYVHILIFAITPVFFLFNPVSIIVAMVFYGVAANIPFIMIQRYNRARGLKALKAL